MESSSVVAEMTPRQALDTTGEGVGHPGRRAGPSVERQPANAPELARRAQHIRGGRHVSGWFRLGERVREIFEGQDASRRWFRSQSRYLGGTTPAEAIRAGRLDRVEAGLKALDSGAFL